MSNSLPTTSAHSGVSKTKFSVLSPQSLLIFLLINLILIGVLAAFNASTLVPARGLRFDFYPHWVGGRAVWRGETPYTPAITREIQMGMFGSELPPDADQQNLAYPAYTSIVLGPVIALPAPTAIALWMAIGLAGVIWTPVIWLAILGWRPAPFVLFALLLGLTFGFHYPIDMLVLAQFSGTVLLALSLGIWLLTLRKDVFAGVIFALATVPPTMGAPLALGILGAMALRGRWRGLAAFLVTMALVVGISILRIGWWIPDWLRVVREYAAYAPPAWPPNFLPLPLRIVLVVAVVLYLGWSLVKFLRVSRNQDENSLLVTHHSVLSTQYFVALLLAALLLIPQTGYYYLVLLIPVIVACLERSRALTKSERRLVWLSCILAVVSPWLYFSIPGMNPEMQSLILPLHVGPMWLAVNSRVAIREKTAYRVSVINSK
jgi:hypothetical protein